MRMSVCPPRRGARARTLVALAGVAACASIGLEATEESRTLFLPAGTADTAVDVVLACLSLVIGGFGVAGILVRRRLHAGDVDTERKESNAARTLYKSACRGLSSENPVVRLEALDHLELLGQAHPAYRQMVVARWCSYLRRPLEGEHRGAERSAGFDRCFAAIPSSLDEITERTVVQRLIGRHLRRVDQDGVFATYWAEVRGMDLEGAHLFQLDFRGCVVPHAAFGGAVFYGDTSFDGARFTGEAAFDEAAFLESVSFERVAFERDVAFCAATFGNDVTFTESSFSYSALFVSAAFHGETSFRHAEFHREVDFNPVGPGGVIDMWGSRKRSGYRGHLPEGWVANDDGTGWAFITPT